jgi:hypothetical protein
MWEIYYTKQAKKDAKKLASAGLKSKAQELLVVIQVETQPCNTPVVNTRR